VSSSGTLDLANYSTVWDHNFASEPNLNGFNTVWGDVQVENGAAVITSTAASGWAQGGFMITPSGAAAGNGYGLYSITMSLSDNGAVEGPGGYACLWPSTNNWPGPELDLVEKQGADSGTNGYSTIHWAGADGSNQYSPTMFPSNIDVTQVHTYAMDWEPGRITLYIDGQEIYTTTQNVPSDYADGGQNEAFGAGEEPAWAASQQGSNSQNQVQVYDISYSAYTPGSGGGSSAGATVSSSTGGTGGTPGTSPIFVPNDGNSSYAATIDATTVVSDAAQKTTFLTGTSNTVWLGGGDGQTSVISGDLNGVVAASDGDTVWAGGSGETLFADGSRDALAAAGNNTSVVLSGTADSAALLGNAGKLWTATDGQKVSVAGTGNTVALGSSDNAVYDAGSGNTIVLTAAAQNNTTWDSILTNGDTIDLSQVLAAANWDGNAQDLSSYLSVADNAWGLELSVHANGGASSQTVLNIIGPNATIGLGALLQHAVV